MKTEQDEKKCCPSCSSEKEPNYGRYKDIEDEGNYFTLRFEYCPDCKYIYYSDLE